MQTTMPHSMNESNPAAETTPLAERLRPESLAEFFGQKNLLGDGRILKELLTAGNLPSIILWGPPGTGKTSLARVIARSTKARFIFFSAVLSGVKEIRQIVAEAQSLRKQDNYQKIILFVDEIHRFNKSQQDAFLPHVESGLFTLIGATTENPSFEVNSPLLSRCKVLVLEALGQGDLEAIIDRALADRDRGLGRYGLTISAEARSFLAHYADGDARRALNTLEVAVSLVLAGPREAAGQGSTITLADIQEAAQHKGLRYDQSGEEHYNLISALHKSLRDSDPNGALYWLYRMLLGGEDPLYLARRLIRFASEDIGIADPQALLQALAARDAYHTLGSPEGELALAQAAVYLATAPKSNAVYAAAKAVCKTIEATGTLEVPLDLRNAPTSLARELGYGKNYQYAHDDGQALVKQQHLPDAIEGTTFYHPTNRGYEALVRERLVKWQEILKNRG